MYAGLVITSDDKIRRECEKIIRETGEISCEYLVSPKDLVDSYNFFNHLFILISDLDHQILQKISSAQLHIPGLSIVFYNHSLNFIDFPDIFHASKVKMIIGENRKADFGNLLEQLKLNFWRKLPYQKLGIAFDSLSPRMKKAMHYIEFAPISDCNISNIAEYLSISSGYFSQEFKRETCKSFRSFMQKVIDYYENLIFSNANLPAKNISQILGYSELSSFSRSFKKRKGISPTKFKKLVQL